MILNNSALGIAVSMYQLGKASKPSSFELDTVLFIADVYKHIKA